MRDAGVPVVIPHFLCCVSSPFECRPTERLALLLALIFFSGKEVNRWQIRIQGRAANQSGGIHTLFARDIQLIQQLCVKSISGLLLLWRFSFTHVRSIRSGLRSVRAGYQR
jgi:hypothetical protein